MVGRRGGRRAGGRALSLGLSSALALALVLTGCGSEETPEAPAASSSPRPSVPPGVDTDPPEPPAESAYTAESAEEQARFVAEVVQHAIRIRDTTPVAALARDQAVCDSCRQLADYVAGLEEDELWEVADDLELGRLTVRATGPDRYRVRGPATYPRISFVDLEGDEQAKQDPSRYAFWVDLRWDADGERWRVEDYALINRGKK